jgi:sugar transferase (PEP-CTERM/EpsH1 system associated)
VAKPIRVMHVVQSLEIGGLENGVVNLLNRLSDERFKHVVCCLTHAGKLAERIRSQDVDVVEMGLPTDRFRFPVMILRRLLRQWAPDIVHTRGWGTIDAIIAARVAGVSRVIHGEHGREASDPKGLNSKKNLIRRALSPMVDRFVCVSDDLRRWLISTVGIAERKVVTVHNGVDLDRFQVQTRDVARRQLGLGPMDFIIGTVGRLDPVKDHLSLLTAFAPIAKRSPNARLLVVGGGPMRQVIESQILSLRFSGEVVLLGDRQDVATIMNALNVFALTSIAEGISNTILEAMASRLPVVATRVGGNPELVQDGTTGQLVEARDVAALTTAFAGYLNDSEMCVRHGAAGRIRAEKYFSLERMAADYAELYLDVVTGKSRIAA